MTSGRALSPTLTLYVARRFATWFAVTVGVVFGIVYMAELIELLRRASGTTVGVALVSQMALWKTPFMALELLPFSILVGAMVTFWHLNRTSELIVARAVGISAWQFLLPAAAISLLIGILRVTVVDPVSAAMTQHFDRMERRYLGDGTDMLTASASGLWLRQAMRDGQTIIHADRVTMADQTFHHVSILNFAAGDRFVSRIDAPYAKLRAGLWHLPTARIAEPNRATTVVDEYTLPTSLSLDQVASSLAPSKSISFWQLPGYIKVLKATGFASLSHEMQWHRLLATPLLFVSMVFLAASFTLQPQRLGRTLLLVGAGISIGFLLYFLSNLIYRVGLTGSIPLQLAAWAPAGLSLLVGITLLLHLEDG